MSNVTLQPIQRNQRIQLLDILRGFAILGIFIMNLYAFTFYFAYDDTQKAAVILSSFDNKMQFLHHTFLEGKFYSIFSLLFGIGFAVYLSKTTQNNNILPLFRRRLLILLLIGILHLLLWVGDIVALYAMLGFLLIPFRNMSNKKLLILAAICIISPIGWYALKMLSPAIFNPAQYLFAYNIELDRNAGIKSDQELLKILLGSDFLKMLQVNLHGIFWRYGDLLFQDRIFKVFGMFLVGLVIGKTKFYNKLPENKKLLKQVAIIGLVVGIPANIITTIFVGKGGYYELAMNGMYQTIAYAIGVAPLALAYAALLALLYQSSKPKKFLNYLAPVGRMALTNYVSHTLIGLFFFTKLGFGINSMGPTIWTLFALGVFIFQVYTSTLWLRFYNYGPLEWLWRSATYGKWQKLRKQKIEEHSNSQAAL